MTLRRVVLVSLLALGTPDNASGQSLQPKDTTLQVRPEQTDLTPRQGPQASSPLVLGRKPTPVQIDTFWRLIQTGDSAAAGRHLGMLQQQYPNWLPSIDITTAVVQLDVDRAVAQRDIATLMRIRQQQPALFDCSAITNMWALTSVMEARSDGRGAIEVYLQAAQDCPAVEDRARAIMAALDAKSPADIQFVLERLSWMGVLPAALQNRVAVPLVTARLRLLMAGSGEARDLMRQRLEADILAAQDPQQATALGSFDLSNADGQRALEWFDRALSWGGTTEAVTGKAAALEILGRPEEARALASQAGLATGTLSSGFRIKTLAAVKEGRVDEAFVDAQRAAQSGSPGIWEDLGWALIDANRPKDAARAFAAAPQRESARFGSVVALGNITSSWADVAKFCRPAERSRRLTQLCGDQIESAAKQFYDTEKWIEVRDVQQRAASLDIRRPALDEFSGWSAFRLKDWSAAVALLEPLYRDGADVGAGILGALGELRRPEDAAKLFEQFSRKPQQDRGFVAGAFNARARAMATSGKLDAALADAKRAGTFDPNSLETFGWAMLDADQPASALSAFNDAAMTENALYGRLLALQRTNAPWKDALNRCGGAAVSERIRQACRDIAGESATKAYDQNRWAEVLAIYDAAEPLAAVSSGLRQLAGWSALRTSDPERAIALFNTVYTDGADVAVGLVQAYRDAGKLGELNFRLVDDRGPLGEAFDSQIAAPLLAEGQYRQVHAAAPQRFPQYSGLDQPSLSVSTFVRSKRGAAGQDQLDAVSFQVQGRYPIEAGELDVSIDRRRIKLGETQVGNSVGSAGPVLTQTGGIGETLITPTVVWRRAIGPWTITAAGGTSPTGGAVDAKPVGRVAMRRSFDSVIAQAELYAEPRQDSLLAVAGMTDPFGGQTWGRVVERGVALNGTFLPLEGWSVTALAAASSLTGLRVESNDRLQLRTGLARQWSRPGFDYIRLGGFQSWQSFDRNLSFFTLGHGGYFSPQNQFALGTNFDFRSAVGQPWLVEGQISLAWARQREAAAPRFPLNPNGQVFLGSQNTGFSFESLLRASRILNEDFKIGAYARVSVAPSYRDYAGGLTFGYAFSPRIGGVPDDLPRFLDRSDR